MSASTSRHYRVCDKIYMIRGIPGRYENDYLIYSGGRWIGTASSGDGGRSKWYVLDYGGSSWEKERYSGVYHRRWFFTLKELKSWLSVNADAVVAGEQIGAKY